MRDCYCSYSYDLFKFIHVFFFPITLCLTELSAFLCHILAPEEPLLLILSNESLLLMTSLSFSLVGKTYFYSSNQRIWAWNSFWQSCSFWNLERLFYCLLAFVI